MEITRKSFLSGAATGLAALAFLPKAALGAAPDEVDGSAAGLRGAVWETFHARGPHDVTVPLTLERAVEGRSDPGMEQYSLLFSADGPSALPEGTWTLLPASGRRTYRVFLVPAGSEPSGRPLLRADFCLLEEPGRRPSRL